MRSIKTYEAWSNKINIGDIYVIDELLIPQMHYRRNINLGRILDKDGNFWFRVKTYIKGTYDESYDEYIFDISISSIRRKATPKQILEFEIIEVAKKYNL